MNIYHDNLISGANAKFLNALLIAVIIFLLGWTVTIWMEPAAGPSPTAETPAKAPRNYGEKTLPGRSSYNLIVKKDLFRASRRKYVAPPKPRAVKRVVRKKPVLKAPSLTLLGTVILDDGKAAMMSFRGRENDAKFYRVGDKVGGFTIKKIDEKSVLLKRGKRTLKVLMSLPDEAKKGGRKIQRQRFSR
ncbi:MAG: hypothetical protein ACE5EB_05605 [Thermodesulfobacteriota bacterium]